MTNQVNVQGIGVKDQVKVKLQGKQVQVMPCAPPQVGAHPRLV